MDFWTRTRFYSDWTGEILTATNNNVLQFEVAAGWAPTFQPKHYDSNMARHLLAEVGNAAIRTPLHGDWKTALPQGFLELAARSAQVGARGERSASPSTLTSATRFAKRLRATAACVAPVNYDYILDSWRTVTAFATSPPPTTLGCPAMTMRPSPSLECHP